MTAAADSATAGSVAVARAEGTTEALAVLMQVKELLDKSVEEGKTQDTLIGWYHSHPGLSCFFSEVCQGVRGEITFLHFINIIRVIVRN